MTEQRSGIQYRLAVFFGAVLGGVYWGLLSTLVTAHEHGPTHRGWMTPADLLTFVATSALTLFVGCALLLLLRSLVRTVGLALVLCALSGWIVVGTVALQSWLWRL
ncbi:CHASE2 domain-containing sensor protein [Mycolicibacterium sp. BK556]|uniref:hypothetical protein n=1 Tax=Mycobacteriaceae TaxID=1762 RepID=UPI00105DC4AB|nr:MULTISPECIES: hypothetical protein [Mycobacteriaceae]MBB3604621.1 CHASE2 domain-containing sensor protein [Mycolicibacterium sp. BK556]MBB3634666.1 CHASE2 domain-containing sensor protein [Mycolicibacterium sp. BK607]MBB3752242.1 CHASE2 domain-containing sensor protein [Mycolicibacterium sp. BK634]TDO17511.1 hypothetical protein EV580_0684 [Mycobacterium sp. BK086]